MSWMRKETLEAPQIVHNQLSKNQLLCQKISEHWRQHEPLFAVTLARGSSDHAASFAKYVLETQLGLPTVSFAPSVYTLYQAPLKLKQSVVIAISQSGQSRDICTSLEFAKKQGALTIALVNQTDSPLANIADHVIALSAETEKAVAATKSYIASLTAILQLVAYLAANKVLADLLQQLPKQMELGVKTDWSVALDEFIQANTTLIVGRGYTYPIAQEAALKCKEVAGIHAESFSGAEVLHGPFALIKPHYPVLIFVQKDESLPSMIDLIERIHQLHGHTFIVAPNDLNDLCLHKGNQHRLSLPLHIHPLLNPILMIQSYYIFIEQVAQRLKHNPDQPANLNKVTNTL